MLRANNLYLKAKGHTGILSLFLYALSLLLIYVSEACCYCYLKAAYRLFPWAAWVAAVVTAGAAEVVVVAEALFDPGAAAVVAALFDPGVAVVLFDPGAVPGFVVDAGEQTVAGWPGVFFCDRFFPMYPD